METRVTLDEAMKITKDGAEFAGRMSATGNIMVRDAMVSDFLEWVKDHPEAKVLTAVFFDVAADAEKRGM